MRQLSQISRTRIESSQDTVARLRDVAVHWNMQKAGTSVDVMIEVIQDLIANITNDVVIILGSLLFSVVVISNFNESFI